MSIIRVCKLFNEVGCDRVLQRGSEFDYHFKLNELFSLSSFQH